LNPYLSFQQTADPSNYAAEPIVKYHLILFFCNISHESGAANKREQETGSGGDPTRETAGRRFAFFFTNASFALKVGKTYFERRQNAFSVFTLSFTISEEKFP